ncbi:lysophospholipid acyltransferase family protein [Desulfobulbus rhabdoformis]|uniref:lysophospholipid acyltransferase family protein n=1 Tax=Desulfobulbus rhabdoformis TaxID=34032 RepID=UPI0019649BA1|nr:lysophospholipid acyltransferase family protein [Desulfobulbus rhabdoformis]MBM9613989.1 lysophospholipid acyltransferase family protein [Desulfobulbus rhabdoformis]
MADFLRKTSLVVVPRLVWGLVALWFSTLRLKVRGGAEFKAYAQQDTGIAAFWHYSFAYLFWYLRKYPAVIMVSSSSDGEYIARLAEHTGHVAVRGSAHRGGAKALLGMIRAMKKHALNAAIVADGSQGPARKAQAGCILAASKSGKPVFPMAWACTRYIRFNSWDQTLLPLPFSSLLLRHGEPLSVPASITPKQVEEYRLELEFRLNRLYEAAWNELGMEKHDTRGRKRAGRQSSSSRRA